MTRPRPACDACCAASRSTASGSSPSNAPKTASSSGRCGFLVWDAETLTPTTEAEAADPTELEIGYALGREFWRQGYATEAATAVRNHALRSMHRTRLIAFIRPGNLASARVAEKLGMRHERDVELMELPARLYALGNEPAR